MMNKYQKTLECIGNIDLDTLSNGYDSPKYLKDFYYGEYKLLQKLVDKVTPKKPIITIIDKEYGSYQCDCPNCGRFLSVNCKDITTVYCPECGQKIDWSDENG